MEDIAQQLVSNCVHGKMTCSIVRSGRNYGTPSMTVPPILIGMWLVKKNYLLITYELSVLRIGVKVFRWCILICIFICLLTSNRFNNAFFHCFSLICSGNFDNKLSSFHQSPLMGNFILFPVEFLPPHVNVSQDKIHTKVL